MKMKRGEMTKEKIWETIENLVLQNLMDKAMSKATQDLCEDCLDHRCQAGRICKEFLRRSKSYAWEMVAEKAELN